MTFAHSSAAPGAVGSTKKLSPARLNGVPSAVLAIAGAATLTVASFGLRNSTEHALLERLNELSAKVRTLEQAAQANEQKAGQSDALKVLQVQQVQTDARVATLAKDVEVLLSLKKSAPPPPANSPLTKSLPGDHLAT